MTEVKPVAWTQQSALNAVSNGSALVGAFWLERDESEHRLKYDDPSMPDDVALYSEPDFLAMKERAEAAETLAQSNYENICTQQRRIDEQTIRAEKAEAEQLEQARLLGMSAEREAALRSELERTERNRDMYKAQCDRQEKEIEAIRIWMRGK